MISTTMMPSDFQKKKMRLFSSASSTANSSSTRKKQAIIAASAATATILAAAATAVSVSSVEAFQAPAPPLSSSSFQQQHHTSSAAASPSIGGSYYRPTTTRSSLHTLFYTAMPDISTMKAMEMKQELESYGISTKSLFDKRDFEQALVEARNDYESTLQDVMSHGKAKTKGPRSSSSSSSRSSRSSSSSSSKSWSSEAPNNGPQDQRVHVGSGGSGGSGQRAAWSTDDPFSQTYRSTASSKRRYNPNSPFERDDMHGPGQGHGPPPPPGGGDRSYHYDYKSGSMWDNASPIEEDPLNEYDNYDFSNDFMNQHFQYHPNDPAAKKQKQKKDKERASDWTYRAEKQAAAQSPAAVAAETFPNNPSLQMKYKSALEEAKDLTVTDLQAALNERGISTKFCMVLADFRHEYAKAIAEDKPIRQGEGNTKVIDDDEDYDPTYRDVVMERYDPSKM
mmetsp:Transcript_61016/g.149395  ORF Transcript_61016/g.149395 Transcript_61016/m.149395 type:complete len:451 (-) Transcript_61016:454-1806(-)